MAEQVAQINYGRIFSTIYWYPEEKACVEFLRLPTEKGKEPLSLLRGSRLYYIKNADDIDQFHSRLQQIGTFSDWLKTDVPSFELSMFYINDLTTGIIGRFSDELEKKLGKMEKEIGHKQIEYNALKQQQKMQIPVPKDPDVLGTEIQRLMEEYQSTAEQVEMQQKFMKEYAEKGSGVSFIIRVQTSIYPARESEIETTLQDVFSSLRRHNNVIKNEARTSYNLVIEDLPHPAIAFHSESLGLFDPRQLDKWVKLYPEIEGIKKDIDSLFIHRWAEEAKIGNKPFDKNLAVAQGVSNFLQKAISKKIVEARFAKPEFENLPIYSARKRQGYVGWVLDEALQQTYFPYLLDYDGQGLTHTAIVGKSGYGKTWVAFSIAEGALIHDIPVLVLDPTGQWTGFLEPMDDKEILKMYDDFQMDKIGPYDFRGRIYTPGKDYGIDLKTNLLAMPATDKDDELHAFASETAGLIREICNLTESEKLSVTEAVYKGWKEGKSLNYAELENLIQSASTKMKLSTLRDFRFLFEGEKLESVESLWKEGEIGVVALNHMATTEQAQMISYFLLREIVNYFSRQEMTDQVRLLLVVEETARFSKEVYKFFDRAARELRKRGVAMVFVTHILVDLAEIRANTATKIYMRVDYTGELERASEDLGNKLAAELPTLPKGIGVVAYPDYGSPVFVKFRPPFHRVKELNPLEIQEKMLPWKKPDLSALMKKPEEAKKEQEEKIEGEEKAADEEIYFQQIKRLTQEKGRAPRPTWVQESLGWGGKRSDAAKQKLLDDGRIEQKPDPEHKGAFMLIIKEENVSE